MYERVSHDFSKQNTILYKYWMHVLASLSLLYTKGEVLPLYLNLVMCVCVCVHTLHQVSHNITKQCVCIHVDPENITMGCGNYPNTKYQLC